MSTVKYCSNCGTNVQQNFQFCTACGAAIIRQETPINLPKSDLTQQQNIENITSNNPNEIEPSKNLSKSKAIPIALGGLILFALFMILGPFKNVFEPASNSAGSQQNQSKNPFTRGMYDAISVGMTYEAVARLTGYTGEELSSNRIEGVPGITPSIDTKMYQWVNADGTNMNAIFQNGKLVQKAQWGLH